jgi:signal transduction histidine kinase
VELILNSMQEGMLVLSDEGEVLQANQMMYQLVGRGYAFTLEEVFEVKREEGGSLRGVILSRSGERIPVQVSQLQLGAAQSGILSRGATLMLFFDLRERVRMEEQEQYLAFQSGVAEMSATLLHNVGNAITGINGYISLQEDRGRQLADVERSLRALGQKSANGEITLEKCAQGFDLVARVIDSEGLNNTTRQMRNGVDRISTILRAHRTFDQQEQVITTFNGCTMVEDAAELVRDDCVAAGVDLTLQCGQQLYLKLPRNPLIQMVLNLLKQGIESVRRRKLLEPGLTGTLTLQMSAAGENRVRLVVSDNGVGVTEQQRSELFVANAAEGGQRLHSVANFANSIGGEIRAESGGEMQGTRFIVVLPQQR